MITSFQGLRLSPCTLYIRMALILAPFENVSFHSPILFQSTKEEKKKCYVQNFNAIVFLQDDSKTLSSLT